MKLLNDKLINNRDIVLVGKILAPHGMDGVLKICSFAESMEVYNFLEELLIKRSNVDKFNLVKITWLKAYRRGRLRLRISGVEDRNSAEVFIGADIYIKKNMLPLLEDDTYFWSDLIGLRVESICGRFLGFLDSVIPTAGNDVYVVKNVKACKTTEILLPAIKSIILSVDVVDRLMIVDLPDGLEYCR